MSHQTSDEESRAVGTISPGHLPKKNHRRWLRVFLYGVAGLILGLAVTAAILVHRFQPLARNYFISALQQRYNSDVELGELQISLFPTVHATGSNLVLWFDGRHDLPPLIRLRRFTLDTDFADFFRRPKHINHVRLEGLQIHTPSRGDKGSPHRAAPKAEPSKHRQAPVTTFILDQVVADGTTLETTPKDPTKLPLTFEIRSLTLHDVGLGQPMTYHAELTNPKPPGLIHADGKFGPWNAPDPSGTPLSGKYTFRNADLSVFKGIAGILSSDGDFIGELDRIEVHGTTETPDFALKTGGQPMPLHTEYQATVDGTNGNTVLHPVHARLGRSEFDVEGAIDRGALETHKTILLSTRSAGNQTRLEDFLKLALKGGKAPMTGNVRFNAKVKVPPGEADVIDRMELDGTFGLNGVRFTSPDVQSKLASLSHRAQGDPKNDDPDVVADFQGAFHLHSGQLGIPDLQFHLPGADVNMAGTYALKTGAIDFTGNAKLDATVSQLTTGLKSKLLKPLDPWFRHDGAGTVIPMHIGGTRGEPSFDIDFGKMLKRKSN